MPTAGYRLVQLANGTYTVQSLSYGEKMHPGTGPAAEAETLYVGQLKIRERLVRHRGEFVVWDVGLGAAANAIAVLRATREFMRPLRLVSFDNTVEPLAFALSHAEVLGYLRGYEALVKGIHERGQVKFTDGEHEVEWEFHLGDFPPLLSREAERRSSNRRESAVGDQASGCAGSMPKAGVQRAESRFGAPHAILFDAFSPAKNPAMWTLPLFTNLFCLLDPARPCALTTYSRSTMLRVTLLLAGFFVGRGIPTGRKEETSVAANSLELIDEPLDCNWLERARRSDGAEPLSGPNYHRMALSAENWGKLQKHEQFVC